MTSICAILISTLSHLAFSHSSLLDGCVSANGSPISHYEKKPKETGLKKRILVFSQIHGDEPQSGELAKLWIKRLDQVNAPSNYWRIIPVLNPDGLKNKTRFNANKVDLNRNFPTKDWEAEALDHWKKIQKSNDRRYPGPHAGSEPETNCAISHINDFTPDLVVALHTPYGLFDFDGPSHKQIKTKLLPWKRLGTFPGSLGRFLWDERGVPVLTIELRPDSLKKFSHDFLKFQDYLSDLTTD